MTQKVYYFNFLSAFLMGILLAGCGRPSPSESMAKKENDNWALQPFTKVDSVNPVLLPGLLSFKCPIRGTEVKWEEKDVFNPAATVRNDTVFLLFRAEDKIGKYAGTSRIGLAFSTDGFNFEKKPSPVLYPDNDSLQVYEWEGGIEDPRIVQREDGLYVLTYTAYDGKVARLMVASSKDLVHWSKHGLVLRGKFKDHWSKSGAIIASMEGEKVISKKINGKYWLYFGDTDLYMATSTDLINWEPVLDGDSLLSVLKPRPGYFDSRLVESGPYALFQSNGILLLYNGMNLDQKGDPSRPAGSYCGGQALFDNADPTRSIDRLESPFICPEKDYEITGQVHHVCFLEGLVKFKGRWLLYYGTADSKIAVAVH